MWRKGAKRKGRQILLYLDNAAYKGNHKADQGHYQTEKRRPGKSEIKPGKREDLPEERGPDGGTAFLDREDSKDPNMISQIRIIPGQRPVNSLSPDPGKGWKKPLKRAVGRTLTNCCQVGCRMGK